MKKLSKYLFALLAASFLTGCNDDQLPADGKGHQQYRPEDAVYMHVTIKPTQVPTGSRGYTDDPDDGYSSSNNGVEIGSEAENRIFNVMLILAGTDNNEFIGYSLIGGLGGSNDNLTGKPTPEGNNSVNLNTSFSRQAIQDYYDDHKDDFKPQVNVFALCNYPQALLDKIETVKEGSTDWPDIMLEVIEFSPSSGKPNTGTSVLSTSGGIFMSNGVMKTVNIPMDADDWDYFSNENAPFDLSGENEYGENPETKKPYSIDNTGSLRVERGIARFDFADASVNGDQCYVIGEKKNVEEGEGEGEGSTSGVVSGVTETLQVKLVTMSLVNMNKQFYILRHVSPALKSGFDANLDIQKLCIAELPWETGEPNGNWVVDWDAAWKNEYKELPKEQQRNSKELNAHFNFALGNAAGAGASGDGQEGDEDTWGITPTARQWWYTSKITDVIKGDKDINDNNWSPDKYDYRVWRYVTENCIPSVDGQLNGVSTGVVFKGLILPVKDTPEDLAAALDGNYTVDKDGNYDKDDTVKVTPLLYVFDDDMYASFKRISDEAVAQHAGSPLFNAVYGKTQIDANNELGTLDPECTAALYEKWRAAGGNVDEKDPTFVAFRKKAVQEKISIYEWSEDADDVADAGRGGYFCYYYYWNRHNDNGKNGVMGPMEFQVVRNNVYKLAVTEIKRLGHPRKTENDPDPEDPGKPDEESNVYFKVKVEVLPWTVRVNNIEF